MLIVVWRWGDWRHWEKYQSTALYFIATDLLYNFLTYNHSLWLYHPAHPVIVPTHTLNNLMVTLIFFPCTVILYLSRYPAGLGKQVVYILFWIGMYLSVEAVFHFYLGIFSYHNGWNYGWSILFNFVMFPMLRLHYKKPLWAYALSVVTIVSLMLIFQIPIYKMK
ncbi:CBO0543 family protein [Fodinisporobacter ferrooxydans]|uniref:CBO0543 family protein n=1 Tax=Fodinisporobacter ferrooxydans TaxID=2901836 RepID=UPI003D313CEC